MKVPFLHILTLVLVMCFSLSAHATEAKTAYKAFTANPDGRTAFAYLYEVAVHPRCANCHGVIEEGIHRPTVGDERSLHPMNISMLNNIRLSVENGEFVQTGNPHPVNCRSCHQNANSDEPGMPPGASNNLMPGFIWHMPPPTMAIPRDLSAQTLCKTWLDPAKNSFLAFRGGLEQMDVFKKEFIHHVKDDPLVRWAWAPGPGRTPAPGTHSDFVKAMKLWIQEGVPCPQ